MNLNSLQSLAQNLRHDSRWNNTPLPSGSTETRNGDIQNSERESCSTNMPTTDNNLVNTLNNLNLNIEEEGIATNSSLNNLSAGAASKRRASRTKVQNQNTVNPQEHAPINNTGGKEEEEDDNNDLIEGEWLIKRPDGQGIFQDTEGNKYEGGYIDVKIDGEDENEVETYFHGKGTFIWADGDIYEGDWVHDIRTGYGFFKSKECTYQGTFFEDEFHGWGKITYLQSKEHSNKILRYTKGDTYEGYFSKNLPHTIDIDKEVHPMNPKLPSVYTFNNIGKQGMMFEGQWCHGRPIGEGLYRFQGQQKNAEWSNFGDNIAFSNPISISARKETKLGKEESVNTNNLDPERVSSSSSTSSSFLHEVNNQVGEVFKDMNEEKKLSVIREFEAIPRSSINIKTLRQFTEKYSLAAKGRSIDGLMENILQEITQSDLHTPKNRRSSGLRDYFHKELKFTGPDASKYAKGVKTLGIDNTEALFEYIKEDDIRKDAFEGLIDNDGQRLFKVSHINKIFRVIQNEKVENSLPVSLKELSSVALGRDDNSVISDLTDFQTSSNDPFLLKHEKNSGDFKDIGTLNSAEKNDEIVRSYVPLTIFDSCHSKVFTFIEQYFQRKVNTFKAQDRQKDKIINSSEEIGTSYHYSKDVLLGEGSFGKVYLGFQKKAGENKSINSFSSTNVAIKVISDQDTTQEAIMDEITNMMVLESSGTKGTTINLLEKIEHSSHVTLWFIIQEVGLCSLQDLHEKIFLDFHPRWLDFEFNLKTIKAICNAVSCLHENNFIHRDIHPSNIMVMQEGYIKLADVALTRHATNEKVFMSHSGTKSKSDRWQPYEVLSKMNAMFGQPELRMSNIHENQSRTYNTDAGANPDVYVDISKSVDIFQLGWTFFYIMCGSDKMCIPFPKKNIADLNAVYAILNKEEPVFPDSIKSNFPLMHLIKCMLSHDSNERPTISCVMNHPIFLSYHDKHQDLENHYKTLSTVGEDNKTIMMRKVLENLILGLRDLGPDITNFFIVEPIKPVIISAPPDCRADMEVGSREFQENEQHKHDFLKRSDDSGSTEQTDDDFQTVAYEVYIEKNDYQEVMIGPSVNNTNNSTNTRVDIMERLTSTSITLVKPKFMVGEGIKNLSIETLSDSQIQAILIQQNEPHKPSKGYLAGITNLYASVKNKDDYKLTLRWRNILTEDIPLIFYEPDKKVKKKEREGEYNENQKRYYTMSRKEEYKENLYNLQRINSPDEAFVHRITVLIQLMNNCCKHLKEKDARIQQAFFAAVRGRQPTPNRVEEFVFLHPATNWLLPAFWEVKYKKERDMKMQQELMQHV